MSQVPPFTALSQAAESLLGQLADEVHSARQRGEPVDLEALAGQYPQLADVIRQVFPVLGALGEPPPAAAPLAGAESLGDFRLLRELGRGGMGIVYEAEQRSLGRRVALKILPLAAMLDERQLRRFRNEAHAAAVLKHPHIVSVYAVGCERGVHFYAMELVEGCSLAELLRPAEAADLPLPPGEGRGEGPRDPSAGDGWSAQRALPDGASTVRLAAASTLLSGDARSRSRAVAQLGVTVAEALAYAHREGIIHRDIKPANLLLDRAGKLWITDFGLARVGTAGDLTMTGDVLGTLRYMSPEQLRGDTVVDERTDVYSLGLTLYEALVERPAFGAGSRETLVRQVLENDPPQPRKLAPQLPADLETIVLRAIDKDRDRRYDTAADLADDLRRFLEHRPIKARRSTWWQTVSRWRRRNPGLAVLLGLLASAGLLLGIGGPLAAFRQAHLAREMDRRLYVADMNLAYEAWYEGNVERTEQLLARHSARAESADQRDFAWKYLKEQFAASERTVLRRYAERLNAVAVSPDGRTVATAGNLAGIALIDLASGHELGTLNDHPTVGGIWSVNFTADGRLLVAAGQDGILRAWDLETGKIQIRAPHYETGIRSANLTPAGVCVVGTNDGKLAAWTLEGERLWEIKAHRRIISKVAVSPDGGQIASASADSTIKLWDAATGRLEREFQLEALAFSVAFSPDGRTLVGGAAEGVYVWDAASGVPLRGLQYTTRPTAALAISQDGILATGGFDDLVQLWDLKQGFRLDRMLAHRDHVWSVAFTPGGQRLVSAAADGTVRVFDLTVAREMGQRLTSSHIMWAARVAVAPDSRSAVSNAGPDPDEHWLPQTADLTAWSVASGRSRWTKHVELDEAGGVAIAPDCRRVAASGQGGITIRDLDLGHVVGRLSAGAECQLIAPAFSPDGRWLAAGGWHGARDEPESAVVLVWDLHAKDPQPIEILSSPGQNNRVCALAFSADARFIAAVHGSYGSSSLDVWALNGESWGRPSERSLRATEPVVDVSFVPGRHAVLAVDSDGVIEFCDLDHPQLSWRQRADSQAIYCCAVSPDGRVLATGLDREIKLWDLQTRDQLGALEVPMYVNSIAFTPDGGTLVWSGGDGLVRFERTGPRVSDTP